jgi:hypothetical protein
VRKLLIVGMTCVVALGATSAAPGSPRPGARAKALAPDLVPLPPEEISGPTTELVIPLGVDAPLIVDGCFLDERIRKGAQRCLRFDGIVANQGPGPLELAYTLESSRRMVVAQQRIFNSDGTYRDRFATRTEYHPTHLHFHVQDFYVASLWRSSAQGGRFGTPVAHGDKSGFCPEDSAPINAANKDASSYYSCFTEDERGVGPNQVVGISAGWKDIYGWQLPDQFVEITGVPDGFYVLEIELDPNNVFVEANETNNKMCVVLELKGFSATLLDPQPPC